MKKFLFSLLVLSAFALTAEAQSSNCAKSCTSKKAASAASCQSKASTASVAIAPEHQAAAAKLASMDGAIETRTNETGGVSYVKKETCAYSGSVSYVDLSYDAANHAFVNVGPSDVKAASAAGCSPKATSASGKAACASGSAAKAGCCSSKAKSASATTASSLEAKPVKTSGGTKN